MGLTSASYALQLKQLLPRGKVWLLEPDTFISKALLALSDEFSRIDQRGDDLIEETDPRTANETLSDWETMVGLPDTLVTSIPGTTAGRRVAITQKYVGLGGQSPSRFIALAAACGYAITISNYQSTLSVAGQMQSGDELEGLACAYGMKVTVSPPSGTALTHAQLEAVIRHACASHIQIEFVYL